MEKLFRRIYKCSQYTNHFSLCPASAACKHSRAHLSSLRLKQVSMLCNILEILHHRISLEYIFRCKCGELQLADCFDSRTVVVHQSEAPTHECVVPTLKVSPCWIALAYITQLHTHQSGSTRVYVRPWVSLEAPLPTRSSSGKSKTLVSKHVQTPAYLRCLVVVIITHTHAHTEISGHLLNKSRRTQLWHVQTKYGSQETLHNLNGMQRTEGLSWNLSPRKME